MGPTEPSSVPREASSVVLSSHTTQTQQAFIFFFPSFPIHLSSTNAHDEFTDSVSRAPTGSFSLLETLKKLAKNKLYWLARLSLFESRGYILRARYKLDWVPSWLKDPAFKACTQEYHLRWPVSTLSMMDLLPLTLQRSDWIGGLPHLRHVSGRRLVLFTRVILATKEVEIAFFLSSSKELREDLRKHCVLIPDVIPDDKDATDCFFVRSFFTGSAIRNSMP